MLNGTFLKLSKQDLSWLVLIYQFFCQEWFLFLFESLLLSNEFPDSLIYNALELFFKRIHVYTRTSLFAKFLLIVISFRAKWISHLCVALCLSKQNFLKVSLLIKEVCMLGWTILNLIKLFNWVCLFFSCLSLSLNKVLKV